MEPTNILPIVAVLSLVTVEYGGWALLSFISGRRALPAAGRFLRPLRMDRGRLLITGVLAQSGGFFLHMGVAKPGTASAGTRLTRTGAVLIGTSLVALGVGLIRTS
jgi:hypothetical protein